MPGEEPGAAVVRSSAEELVRLPSESAWSPRSLCAGLQAVKAHRDCHPDPVTSRPWTTRSRRPGL